MFTKKTTFLDEVINIFHIFTNLPQAKIIHTQKMIRYNELENCIGYSKTKSFFFAFVSNQGHRVRVKADRMLEIL